MNMKIERVDSFVGSDNVSNGICIFAMHAAKAKDFRYNLSEVLQGRIIEECLYYVLYLVGLIYKILFKKKQLFFSL